MVAGLQRPRLHAPLKFLAGRRAVLLQTVLAQQPIPFVRDVLGDGGQKVGGGKDLEVAVDLGIKPGAVDDEKVSVPNGP